MARLIVILAGAIAGCGAIVGLVNQLSFITTLLLLCFGACSGAVLFVAFLAVRFFKTGEWR